MTRENIKTRLLRRFCPSRYSATVFDIDYTELRDQGRTNLLFDLDNTLVARDSNQVSSELKELFERLLDEDFKIVIVSNNWGERVSNFGKEAGVPVLGRAVKPLKRAFRLAMDLIGSNKDNSVAIGDQLFTDIYGANQFGLMTILVSPVSSIDLLHTKMLRHVERGILDRLTKLGFLQNWQGG